MRGISISAQDIDVDPPQIECHGLKDVYIPRIASINYHTDSMVSTEYIHRYLLCSVLYVVLLLASNKRQ